ncbi:MAG: glycosyltransferase [Bacteroidia bacterium]|nr:glycosyltransferase [Bacteroidia bacterium]
MTYRTATLVSDYPTKEQQTQAPNRFSNPPKGTLYATVLLMWIGSLVWFHPRLAGLMDMATGPATWLSLGFFIVFVEFAWLYGFYNLGIVIFALITKLQKRMASTPGPIATTLEKWPSVAMLYTTCNDFVEVSAESCVAQAYPNFTVYILDDSNDPLYQARVDNFAERYPELVQVVRREDRKAFKAGNMNHGLTRFATEEPYFAIADADEILPTDFLTKLVPLMETDPSCGFIQASHRANPAQSSPLAKALGIGIDLHWKWYQPLRNKYGFVMFLGHGALLRRSVWEEIGGFPDIVSEDLGFAIRAREKGYRGRFVEEVVCFEDFPEDVRSFRVRHMKWTRGTCEFLYKEAASLIRSKNITWMEKLDILFPTMNLPLTLLYLMFMLNANLVMPALFGVAQPITFAIGGQEIVMPIVALQPGFNAIFTGDFFFITLLTFFAPVLCFIIGMAHKPLKLFKFLSHSTALYAALGPLSSVGVLSFAITRKAIFLVTGDKNNLATAQEKYAGNRLSAWWNELVGKSHPDHAAIQGFEVLMGLIFIWVCIRLMQVSFLGLCLGFILLPVMHHVKWENSWIRKLVYLPFVLILIGLGLGTMSAFGMSTVFFGYGFHF